ncbi:hypothetical protein TRVL_10356 [Trypanosoma vivax]|nr:hypothetical protein TRVL_10356 [Trypanosoma vivax]
MQKQLDNESHAKIDFALVLANCLLYFPAGRAFLVMPETAQCYWGKSRCDKFPCSGVGHGSSSKLRCEKQWHPLIPLGVFKKAPVFGAYHPLRTTFPSPSSFYPPDGQRCRCPPLRKLSRPLGKNSPPASHFAEIKCHQHFAKSRGFGTNSSESAGFPRHVLKLLVCFQ